jgi:hypothetical protein
MIISLLSVSCLIIHPLKNSKECIGCWRVDISVGKVLIGYTAIVFVFCARTAWLTGNSQKNAVRSRITDLLALLKGSVVLTRVKGEGGGNGDPRVGTGRKYRII